MKIASLPLAFLVVACTSNHPADSGDSKGAVTGAAGPPASSSSAAPSATTSSPANPTTSATSPVAAAPPASAVSAPPAPSCDDIEKLPAGGSFAVESSAYPLSTKYRDVFASIGEETNPDGSVRYSLMLTFSTVLNYCKYQQSGAFTNTWYSAWGVAYAAATPVDGPRFVAGTTYDGGGGMGGNEACTKDSASGGGTDEGDGQNHITITRISDTEIEGTYVRTDRDNTTVWEKGSFKAPLCPIAKSTTDGPAKHTQICCNGS